MWANFNAVGSYDDERTPRFNAEDCVNWYVIMDQNGKKPTALAGTPGLLLEKIVQDDTSVFRALFAFQDNMYGVIGDNVWQFAEDLTSTLLGSIGTSTGFVSIAANTAGEVMFVDGQFGYIYDTNADTFTQITDVNFPPNPTMVTFLDGYFLVTSANTFQVNFSAPNQGTSWDAFNFFFIQAYPGNCVGIATVNRRLYIFKDTSTEVWYNAGNATLPFARDNNLIFNWGAANAASIVSQHGYLLWLSQDTSGISSIMMGDGQSAQPVSIPSIDNKIRNFISPDTAVAYIYKDDGHVFAVYNWTIDDTTFVYDITTTLWHRMEMLPHKPIEDDPFSGLVRHVAQCHAFFNNQHYVGSYKAPILYSMSLDYPDNAGESINRIRVFRHLSQGNYRCQQINALQIDFQTGIGSITGINRFPQAYLSISKDGGESFGNEIHAPLGPVGNRWVRTIWRQLGKSYDFVAKVTIYNAVHPIFMLGGAIDSEVLDV